MAGEPHQGLSKLYYNIALLRRDLGDNAGAIQVRSGGRFEKRIGHCDRVTSL